MPIFFILITVLLFSPMVSPEVLKRVEVIGNKRTSTNAIIQHGRIKIGKEFDQAELKIIKENLGRIDQIYIKNIDFKDSTLKIEVVDKWTIFPIPVITQSGSYQNRGVVIYDNNFLGTLGTLAPGFSWSNSLFNYLLYFQNESLFSSNIGIKVLVMKKSEYVKFERFDEVVDIHELRYDSYLLAPNYLYKNHVFKAGPIYLDKSIYKNNGKIFGDRSQGLFFRHHWNAFQTMEVMYEGFVTTYDLYVLKSQKEEMVYLNEANIYWSIPNGNSFLNFGLHGYLSSERSYLSAKNIGGDEGFRGHAKASLPVSANIGGLVQYQQLLVNRLFLTPFYELNSNKLIDPILNGKRFNENTLGIGFRYYFKKISIPAVIFDAARNIDDKSNHFHINIGLSI